MTAVDYAAARDDLRAFAEMAGRPMTEWQAASLRLDKRITAIVAPRQSGKSWSLAMLASHRAVRSPGFRVLIVSAGEEAAKRLLAEVRSILTSSPILRGSVVAEAAGLVTLTNGSEIRSVPASEKQIRGWSSDLLIEDEAALLSEALVHGAAHPTTAARPDARIVMASSPTSASGPYYDTVMMGRQGSDHVATFAWALTDCEWIAPSVIEAARESMSPTRFAAEYEGVFASAADALFPRHLLDRVTAPFVVPGLHGLAANAGAAGCDWGVTTDATTLVSVGRFEAPDILAVICAHAWRSGAQLDGPGGIIGEIADSAAVFERVTMETNGVGYPLAQSLARRLRERPAATRPELAMLTTSAASKSATYGALRMLMEQGRLVLPASAEGLLRELLLLRVALSQTGGERIEAGVGHDDLCDALAAALGPYQGSQGDWRTRLGDVAEGMAPPRSYELPGATVETGGGLVLPRVPNLRPVGVPHPGQVRVTKYAGDLAPPVIQRAYGLTLVGKHHHDKPPRRAH